MLTGKLMGAGGTGRPPIEYIGGIYSDAQAGDLVVLGLDSIQTWNGNLYIPSGWSILVYSLAPSNWYGSYKERTAVCYRVVQAGDTQPSTSPWNSHYAVYRPNKAITSVQPVGETSSTTNSTYYLNCANDVSGCDAFIAYEGFHAWTMTSARSYTVTSDSPQNTATKFNLFSKGFTPDDVENIRCSGGSKTSPGYTTYYLIAGGYLRLFY